METEKITAGWLKFIQMTGSGWAVKNMKPELWIVKLTWMRIGNWEIGFYIVNLRWSLFYNTSLFGFLCLLIRYAPPDYIS